MKSSDHNNECRIHGHRSSAVNKTLVILMLASLLLVAGHVWFTGPVKPELAKKPFAVLLAGELWDLIAGKSGIAAEMKDVFVYFMIGVFLAGLIRTYKLAIKLRNSLNRYGFLSIFLAALVGVLTPLCACGILTTAMTLIFAGLPLAPVMALLVSSPLISPSSYLLTLNDLGPHWTVVRLAAAFSMGIFAGVLTHVLRNRGFKTGELLIEGAVAQGDFHDEDYPDEHLKCGCRQKFGNRVAARTDNMFVVFLAKSSDMLWLVGKYVLVGIAIGTVVERYMPSSWIYRLFGRQDSLNVVWITFGAVPIFLHQISASSILYHIKSSLDSTMSSGAGLAFLIGGPVTAIPTMTMLWAVFRKKVFFLYMFISVAGTIVLAYSMQALVFTPYVDTGNPLLAGVSSVSGGDSAIITKAGKDVRIVMDPGSRNMIATYSDPLAEKGGAVFDAGFERFMNSGYDNNKYVENIASWLEDNSSLPNSRSILVYNTFKGSGIDNRSLNFKEVPGFTLRMTDRKETPALSAELLDEYGQVWLIFGGTGQGSVFTDIEMDIISGFNKKGGSMLVVTGHESGQEQDQSAVNRLTFGYGVTFSGAVRNEQELEVSASAHFFKKVSDLFSRFYRSMT